MENQVRRKSVLWFLIHIVKIILRTASVFLYLSFQTKLLALNISSHFPAQMGAPEIKSDTIILNFSHTRGFYQNSFMLSITSNDPLAKIIYTIDCSTPTSENGIIYTSAISVDSTMVVKAIGITGTLKSSVQTYTFLFVESILKQPALPKGYPATWGGSSTISADYEIDPMIAKNPDYTSGIREAFTSVPTLALSMSVNDWFNPATGIYVGYPNSDVTREKAMQAEFIFPSKQENFLIDCGLQNQGGTSIVNWKVPKQSMRMLFKEPYGPTRLKYKLFPDSKIESINTLVVDGFLYGWVHPFDSIQRNTSLFFRDQLCSDLQNKMGWLSFHGIYVNLFINGLYWGMYDLHERPDDAFLSEYFDESRENFEILKHNPDNIVQGSNVFYNQMLNLARMGLQKKEALTNIRKFIDLPAFIDYMILNFYLGNFDWAHQNYYVSRNWQLQSPFRYYTWDAEHVMRYSDVNYNNTLKNDKGGPTEIHTYLKQNEEYRLIFADAVYKHCFNKGALTPESFEESFIERRNEIEKAVILESARWGDYLEKSTKTTYSKNVHWLPEIDKVLKNYIPKRRDIFINQLKNSSNKLFPSVLPPLVQITGDGGFESKIVTLANTNSVEGDVYFTLDGSDPRETGGVVHGAKYLTSLRVEKTTVLKARFKDKNTGEWSALAEELLLFGDIFGKGMVINEIMYNPENNFPEFLELINSGESPVNLKGFELVDGISFYFFSDIIIQPGAGIVLSSDTALFRKAYLYGAYGQFSKKLRNEGETLILKNNFKQVVDSVSYKDTIPWPAISGNGYSIELIDNSLDNSLAQSWKISGKKNGTPYRMETHIDFKIITYPNPFDDMINLEIENQELSKDQFRIDLFNNLGKLLKSLKVQSYNSMIQLNIPGLIAGIYYFHITPVSTTQYKNQVVKVVKLK